jgi:hypothetical protein
MGFSPMFIDMLGFDIHLLHKNSTKFKTQVGLAITLINLCFVIFAAIYFGIDIIYLSKPSTRSSSIYLDKAAISLKDFPVMIEFFELTGKKIYDFDKYVTLGGSYFEINTDPYVKYYRLHWEPCDIDKHFSKYKDLILKTNITLNDTFCLDPFKATLQGSAPFDDLDTVYKNLSFQNEHSSVNSKIISAQLFRCDEKRDNKKCSNDDRNVLKEFFARFVMVDHYIDLKSYEKPQQEFLMFYAQMITSDFYKRSFFSFRLNEIKTDSGFFFENEQSTLVHQYQSFRNDVALPDSKFYELTLDVSRVQQVNYRSYVKVQEILANVGGIFKFLFLTAQLLLYYYTKYSFYFDISECFFYRMQEPIINKNASNSNINISSECAIKNNIITRYFKKDSYKSPEEQTLKIDLRFNEFSKLLLCRKSDSKRRDDYRKCINLVDDVIEIKNIVNLNLATNHLINLMIQDPGDKIIFNSKFNLDKFMPDNYLVGPDDNYQPNKAEMVSEIYKTNFLKLYQADTTAVNG